MQILPTEIWQLEIFKQAYLSVEKIIYKKNNVNVKENIQNLSL